MPRGHTVTVTLKEIQDAYQRIESHIVKTPLLNSPRLDAIAGRTLWLKAEPLQVTGSFKFRGACSAVSALSSEVLERGVVAYSSGNHAQGVALAAKIWGARATIIMPHDAPLNKVANTEAYGARVIHYKRGVESREAIGKQLATEEGLHLIKPYDDPHVIAGQGSIGLELADQLREAGAKAGSLLCCCGGGGLSAGLATALQSLAKDITLHTVEPEGLDDTARSLSLGERVTNATERGSICDAIVTPTPGELTFPVLKRYAGPGFAVSDSAVLNAMKVAFDTLKLVIEPGGAVALAAALDPATLPDDQELVVVASGGNVDERVFQQALQFE
jgi:threonine dehydratase